MDREFHFIKLKLKQKEIYIKKEIFKLMTDAKY